MGQVGVKDLHTSNANNMFPQSTVDMGTCTKLA